MALGRYPIPQPPSEEIAMEMKQPPAGTLPPRPNENPFASHAHAIRMPIFELLQIIFSSVNLRSVITHQLVHVLCTAYVIYLSPSPYLSSGPAHFTQTVFWRIIQRFCQFMVRMKTLKYSTCAYNDVWSHSFSYPHSLQKEAKDRGEMKVLLVSFTVYRITNILLVKNLCEWAKSAENLTLCDLTIAFWQGSCVFSSNNLGFIVANWSTIVKFANVWCSQSILVVLGIHMPPLLR